ncbi:pre-mRNA 3' end processing protein WDR33 isoform X2 [Callorhinchus milii]|uniref:pre-mRNA 3' end processing protein WDR33 n=1 Tax=Callorhinchus milii TaxID=7868 RepID=A0A4W3J0D8_CALMI|nr:pre-mRNA 3' end processing protein WDR33 isoform X2 [Callorhinchus milii]|eukprot:gi/632934424/ref/XP_007883218.1/ PREDICTED: pre-mRNA 3' end processing protein WDR33 isoform X2 [Callorhinchus milii]
MAMEITSPPRFFHMPRFQHQGPRHSFYKRPDYAQQQAMQQLTFDGKRMRKAVNRKTIDYNPSVIKFLENRIWQRDHRDLRAIQPDAAYYNDLVPPMGMLKNPMNAVTTKFVRTSTNKVKCPVFVVRWTPEGRRLVTGASSGEFTLWNGLTFNFETILQAHDSPVRAMTWSHNDMWMLTADHCGYVKYWQSNMNNVKMFQAHKEAIREASFSPTDNKFATCSDDGTVRIWDFLRCHEERILRGHGADVKCVDWHPTKGLVVSGSKDSQQPIKFWDPKTGQSLATLHAHKNTVMEVKWNQNGNWLLTASRDHLCKLFDIRNLKEELQIFRGHKKEATAVAWHPVHEGLFASGGSDGSLLFWHVGVEKEVGGMEMAHEGMIWSLAWHPLGHILCSGSNDHTSKFWTRNRPGDKMRDRYNLNLLPGMSDEAAGEYDDIEPNSLASIPGMGIPEQLKQALEMEQASKEEVNEVEMAIPGLDWGMDEMMLKDQKKVIQKKVPYAKPIPVQFQQAWSQNKVLTAPIEMLKIERAEEKKLDEKKKSQAEIEQEMAALQYTNPLLLEQLKIERMAQKQAEQVQQQQGPPLASQSFSGPGFLPQPPQGFQQNHPPQQMQMNMSLAHSGPQGQFRPPGQIGPPVPSLMQGPPVSQGLMGPQGIHGPGGPPGPQGFPGPQNHPGQQGLQGPHGQGLGPKGHPGPQGLSVSQGMQGPSGPRGMQGPPMQGMQGPPQGMQGPPHGMPGHPQGMQGPPGPQGPQGAPGGQPHPQQGTSNMQGPPHSSPAFQQPAKPSLLGDGPRMPFNQGTPNQVPPLMMSGMGQQGPVRVPASNQGPPGPGSGKGDGSLGPTSGAMIRNSNVPNTELLGPASGVIMYQLRPGMTIIRHPGPGPIGALPSQQLLSQKGEPHGPPNHHMGHPQEMRHDQNMERDPDHGPFRGAPDWPDPREKRPSAERRGPLHDFHDRFDPQDKFREEFRKDERFVLRPREFEGRGGPLPHEEGWRRGLVPQRDFPPDQEFRDFVDPELRGPNRGLPQGWDGRKPPEERFGRDPEDARFRGRRDDRFRRGGARHDVRGPRGRDGFLGMDEFIGNEEFEKGEENSRGRDPGGRGRGRGVMRGGRGGLLPLPSHEEFPRFEAGRKSEKRPLSPGGHRDGWVGRGDRGEIHETGREPGMPGRDHCPDDSRQDQSPRDGQSPVSRERPSSLHSMDTASLPPRKRPWYEGPGTPDQRDLDTPGPTPDDRGQSRSGPGGAAPRVAKTGRSNSHEGEHHDGFHRDDGFSGPGGAPPRSTARGGPNWARSGNSSGQPSRRGSSRGSRGR